MNAGNPGLNNGGASVPRALVPIQIWIVLFSAGLSILAARSVVYNLFFNHLMSFQWGHLGLVLATAGVVGFTAHLPDQLNLWKKLKAWANQHKVTASLLLLGTVMLNPTFTCLMALTSYLLEKHAARYLDFLSGTLQAVLNYTVEFFEFMGKLRDPVSFIKGVWLNLGKISAVFLGIGSAVASYMSIRWVIDPLFHSALHVSIQGMHVLGSVLNHTFSGGFIPMVILNTMAATLAYTMTVIAPLSIAMMGGMTAAWAWENRFKFSNAIDNKLNELTKTYCDPVFTKLAVKTRRFRVKYMGLSVLPVRVEGSDAQVMSVSEERERSAPTKEASADVPTARTYIVRSRRAARKTKQSTYKKVAPVAAAATEVVQGAEHETLQVERRYPVRHRKQTARLA